MRGSAVRDLNAAIAARRQWNIGKLGLNHAFVIHRKEESFDVLSDYTGVLYIPYEPEVWEFALARALIASAFNIDLTKLLG